MSSRLVAFMILTVTLVSVATVPRWGLAEDTYTKDSFNFTKGDTTTEQLKKACSEADIQPCFPNGCKAIITAFVPPGDTTLRVSFENKKNVPYGKCVTYEPGKCDETNGVPCAEIEFYGKAKCGGTSFKTTVYKNPGCVPLQKPE